MNMTRHWNRLLREAPGEPAGGAAPVDTTPAPVEAGPDLSFIPADFHVEGKPDLGKFASHYQELSAADAARKAAMAEVPEDGAYDFALPDDLKFDGLGLPDDFKVELAKDDPAIKPLFDELSGVMKEYGLPKSAAPKLAALVAKYDATRYAQAYSAIQQEMAALGPQAQTRIQTIERKLQTMLPADQVDAIRGMTQSAKAVMALEKILGPSSLAAPVPEPSKQIDDLAAYYATPTRKR